MGLEVVMEDKLSLLNPLESGLFLLTPILFAAWALSTFAFSRLTMVRIERQIQREGLPRPAPWDTMGLRLNWYAYVIVASRDGRWNRGNRLLIDVDTIRQYATPSDRIRAWAFLISGFLFIALGLFFTWALDLA